jgi:hypothetical protein
MDIQQREADHKTEALVEKFIDWVETMKVWADEEGFSWQDRNGLYVEEHDGNQDAILVPGQKVVDWQRREDAHNINLSRELRERGILLGTADRETIGDTRRRAWAVNAAETSHTFETALRQKDSEDEDAPEGLR